MDTAQQNLREGRALGLRASQAMLDGYATLASGVLIGISEALQQKQSPPAAAPRLRPAQEAVTRPVAARRRRSDARRAALPSA